MQKIPEPAVTSVNRREFLERAVGTRPIPSITAAGPAADRPTSPQRTPVNGTAWMNEQPLVFTQTWRMPLYPRRAGKYPLWTDDNWDYGFTEKAAKEMRDIGVTAMIVGINEGYGLTVEGKFTETFKTAAAMWRRYGIRVGAYVGSTLHYETLLVEKPEAEEWLVPVFLGQPGIYDHRTDRRWPYFMHPGFREYTKRGLKIAIEDVKVDLFSFDHTSMQAEPRMFFHPLAIEDFRNYLRTKYTAQELLPWLGTSDLRYVVPPNFDWPQSAIEDRMFQEWMDFRCQMLARYYEEMATFIHDLNPAVAIITNPHTGLSGYNTAWDQGVDYPRLIPHMQAAWSEESNYPDVTAEGILISEIRTFLMANIFGARTLTYTGIPGIGLLPDENHIKLQMSQSMAYGRQCLGEIGTVYDLHKLPEGAHKYIQYFHNKFELYRDVESAADVAILHSYASLAYNNDRPYQRTRLFEQALIQSQIPFDIIFDEHLKDLSKYRVLVLADQECIDEKQCDLVRLFVQGGGGVVATEFTSLFTNRHVRRPDFQLADLFKVKAPEFVLWVDDQPLSISPVRNQIGPGRVIYVAEVKPAIVKPSGKPMTSEYWKLPVNRDELVDAVRWASGGRLTLEVHGAPLTVTVNLLRQRSSGALQVHCVNFDMGGNPEVENIKVSVRLPEGKSTPQVRVHSPDQSETQSITPVIRDGTLECELPRLQFYSLLEIR